MPWRVVAPTRQNLARFRRTERAPTPCSSMMSMTKSSMALYKYSSICFGKRWISSMKRTSPSSRPVSRPARSPGFSMTGPLVDLRLTPRALAMMVARVVLPRPGGPHSKRCASASSRWREASTMICRRSLTPSWPGKSAKTCGRRVCSKTSSRLLSSEVMNRSDGM